MNALMLLIAIAVTLAIFATTTRGRELRKRMGFRDRVPGAASSQDDDYLLAACGGDRRELERRIAIERERYPELTEAEHYRRVIRKVFAARDSRSE
jgi:hypothetical protein